MVRREQIRVYIHKDKVKDNYVVSQHRISKHAQVKWCDGFGGK